MKRRKVNSPRNSVCAVKLADLDWKNWWIDGPSTFGEYYLHVAYKDGAEYRVFSRSTTARRLRMINGELYWLMDE